MPRFFSKKNCFFVKNPGFKNPGGPGTIKKSWVFYNPGLLMLMHVFTIS